MVPTWTDEAPFTASVSQTPLNKADDLWRVFSGLEGEEEEEEEDEEVVEDGVREEEETMLAPSGKPLDTSSVATETLKKKKTRVEIKVCSLALI